MIAKCIVLNIIDTSEDLWDYIQIYMYIHEWLKNWIGY